MKNKFWNFLSFVLVAFAFAGCSKSRDLNFDFYFLTRVDTTQTIMSLYVDDKFISQLPYIPDISDTASVLNAVSYTFKKGRYTVSAKDANGTTRAEMKVKVNWNGLTSQSKSGKVETHVFYFDFNATENNPWVVDMYY